MDSQKMYEIIDEKIYEGGSYKPNEPQEISITDEQGRTLNIKAWKNSKGYIHFQTDEEQYRFTGKKEIMFEGWV